MFDGKLCASTTRYNDQTKAACGCGESDPIPSDWWTLTKLTAALNCKNLDTDHPLLSWCPSGCGGCYRLCTTGGTTQGLPTKPGVCRTFKITNRCGDGFDIEGGRDWCNQHMSWKECLDDPESCKRDGNTNWFGYSAHFDLQDFHHQVRHGLGWDNVEVTFEPVPCNDSWTGPSWDCKCPAIQNRTAQRRPVPTVSPSPTGPASNPAVPASGSTLAPLQPVRPSPGTPAVPAPGSVMAPLQPSQPTPGTPAVPASGSTLVPLQPLQPTRGPTLPPLVTQPPVPTTPRPVRCAGAFEQCGGKGWSGSACCEPGCECSATVAIFWQQCVPPRGAKTCSGGPAPAWSDVIVRKDSASTGGAFRGIWLADGAEGGRERQRRPVATTLVVGGLLLAVVAVAFLGLGSLAAFGAASLRQRLRRGPAPHARAGQEALVAAGGAGSRYPRRAASAPALPPAEHLEPSSPSPMLPLAC